MNPSMKEQLKQWKEANPAPAPVKAKPKAEKPRRKKQEKLSERDLKELMGRSRARYGRAKGGAFRQK
ncbi:hypothetical protein ABER98_19900 [Domibacillus aminovorans]|uniref:hypothetical protein n=1 Tax=Domibacillus aminovorans TaxID=29332 RepID=UPI003D1C0E6A